MTVPALARVPILWIKSGDGQSRIRGAARDAPRGRPGQEMKGAAAQHAARLAETDENYAPAPMTSSVIQTPSWSIVSRIVAPPAFVGICGKRSYGLFDGAFGEAVKTNQHMLPE